MHHSSHALRHFAAFAVCAAILIFALNGRAVAQPSVNFTINGSAWLTAGTGHISLRSIAELAATLPYQQFPAMLASDSQADEPDFTTPNFATMGMFAVLLLGLVFGLKHATEVDHVVAVSAIVSEHRKLWRAALVGALWGAGHTASLVVVGVAVLALRVAIPAGVANWLEFGVALMIIGLGANALRRALGTRTQLHRHRHQHDGAAHAHLHFHESEPQHGHPSTTHSHAVRRIGLKPLVVGMVHGLAGSAALTLLVLTQISAAWLGLLYLLIFGVGSIFGMLLMSGLVGLPFALSSRRFTDIQSGLQIVAGCLSVAFGIWYAYQTGLASSIWKSFS